MPRTGLLAAWLVIGLAVFLLTFEGWLPGQTLLPLAPGDFPAWQAGVDEAEALPVHPAPNFNMSDVLHLLVPGLATTRAALGRGELPLWDPSQACGVPHLAQVHYAVYYPPAWLPLLLGLRGLGLLASLHLLLAAGGTLLYLRAIGRSPMAALLGAVAFGFSAWTTARLQSFPAVGAAVWLPWMLLGFERAARGAPRFGHGLAAVAGALSLFAGFPQVTLLVFGLVLLVELVRVARRAVRARRGRMRRAGEAALPSAGAHGARVLLAVGLSALLAAPQWLPTLDYLRTESDRSEVDLDALVAEQLEVPLLHHLVVPDYFASARFAGPHPLALEHLEQARNPVSVNRAETSMGIGAVGLLLAVAAMLFGRHWLTRTWSVVALLVFVLLLWPDALRWGATLLPPLRFGSPRRLLLLSSFALAVLAAGGVDLLRQARLRVAIVCWAGSLLVTAWALVLLTGVPATDEEGDLDVWARNLAAQVDEPGVDAEAVRQLVPTRNFLLAAEDAFDGALLACLVGLVAVVVFRPRASADERGWVTSAERAPALLVALVLVQLGLEARPLLRPLPTDAVSPEPGHVARLHVPPLASALRAAGSATDAPTRVIRLGDGTPWLRPNLPGLFGLSDVSAYAPMVPRRMAELVERLAPTARVSGSRLGGLGHPAQLRSPLLDLLAVDVVLTEQPFEAPPGWSEHERVGPVRLLVPERPVARARVVPAVRVEPDAEARLAALAQRDFAPDELAYVAAPVPGLHAPAEPGAPGAGRRREVELVAARPGAYELRVKPGDAGLLVLAETFHAGWEASFRGEARPVVAADHALLGVPLPAGEGGRLSLTYAPSAPFTGLGLGALGVLALLGTSWTGLLGRRRRRGSAEPDDDDDAPDAPDAPPRTSPA